MVLIWLFEWTSRMKNKIWWSFCRFLYHGSKLAYGPAEDDSIAAANHFNFQHFDIYLNGNNCHLAPWSIYLCLTISFVFWSKGELIITSDITAKMHSNKLQSQFVHVSMHLHMYLIYIYTNLLLYKFSVGCACALMHWKIVVIHFILVKIDKNWNVMNFHYKM